MTNTALATVLERAVAERDAALAALLRAEEMARRARTQAEQLHGYRSEYHQRWQGQFARQGAVEIVHCYRSFMDRLDEAIDQQAGQAGAHDAHCARLREALAAAELRVASVQKLIERRAAEQLRAQTRREQRHTDEMAQQAHWRRRAVENASH